MKTFWIPLRVSVVLALFAFAWTSVQAQERSSALMQDNPNAHESSVDVRGWSVLYDQTQNTTESGYIAFYDLDEAPDWVTQAADDFVVPEGESWDVYTVYAQGFYLGLLNAPAIVRVYFYSNGAGNQPGGEVFSASLTPSDDVDGLLTLDLPEPVTLGEGTYWVSVQPEMDYFADGRWYWLGESAASGAIWHWREGGSYGSGCDTWTPSDVCFSGPQPALSFALFGEMGGGGGDPAISVPTSVGSTQDPGTVATVTMDITNSGGGSLEWSIFEDGSASRVTLSLDQVNGDRLMAPTAGTVDSRFESMYPSAAMVPMVVHTEMAPSRGMVEMIIDDGTAENSIGVGGIQFLWLNRFTPSGADFPFTLEQIEILFPGSTGVEVGQMVDFYVYEDDDSNPANGAFFVGSLLGQQIQSLEEFWIYDVDIEIEGLGDVLIAAVMRTATGSAHFPAAIDETATQARSWAGYGAGVDGNPPMLQDVENFILIDEFFPGNWLIRGYGTLGGGNGGDPCEAPSDIPWLTVSPTSGTTSGGSSSEVTLEFDSTDMDKGLYEGLLCIESNDADNPLVMVEVSMQVSVSADGDGSGRTFDLFQNYPNPFAGTTTVSFELPHATHVTIEVLDVTGRRVALLVDEQLGATIHEVTWDASGFASGVYLYRMVADGFTKTLRTTLVR